MIKNLLSTLLLLLSLSTLAQDIESRVKWNYSYDHSTKVVSFEAQLDKGWHMYSQHLNPEIGPVPTSFSFYKSKGVKLVGETNEPLPIKKFDPNFEGEVSYFEGNVVFQQEISIRKKSEVKGTITYMVCNDTMCLPPNDERFIITINK